MRLRVAFFERFTRFGRAALAQAEEEARRLNGSSVQPEHIFLGLVGQHEGVAGSVLAHLGVTLDAARQKVESLAPAADRPARSRGIGFSRGAKRVLVLALAEARRLRHNYIGTEHMLLALFQLDNVPDSAPIADVMQQFRLDAGRIRDLIMRELTSRGSLLLQGERNNVLMCRVRDSDLEAIDTLVEAGVRTTRSDAAAWLIHAGIEGNRPLFERLQTTVLEIRRLREQAQAITREVASGESPTPPTQGDDASSGGEARPGA